MYRYFQSYDFNSEVEKEILRSKHLIQIVIDEFGFLRLKQNLIEKLKEGISTDIVLLSSDENKSIKLVNLAKKIIDLNGNIFFINDYKLLKSNDFFAIFDKSYLISKNKLTDGYSNEKLFIQKNSLFESFSVKSNFLNLMSGNIDIIFKSDKSIVNKNELFKLSWNVKNAHEISIDNKIGEVSKNGSVLKKVIKDSKFGLTAKNRDFTLKKIVFIKIYSEDTIDISVKVQDNLLKKFIEISPASNTFFHDEYAVFKNQKVRLDWDISTEGRFYESSIGDLKLKGQHEFVLNQNCAFSFTYLTEKNKHSKRLSFYGFEEKKSKNKKSILKSIVNKVYSILINK